MKRKIEKVSSSEMEQSFKPSQKWFKRRNNVAGEGSPSTETPTFRLNSLVPLTEDGMMLAECEQDIAKGMASIFQKYWKRVMGSALRYLGDSDEAQDAASEIFMKVMEKLKRDRPRHLGSWLYMVVQNHCIELLRKRKRKLESESIDTAKVMWVVEDDEDMDVRSRRSNQVRSAMSELPECQRLCLELTYIDGLSYKEIAEETGMDLKAIKSHIQNGRRRLIIVLGKQSGANPRPKKAS